MKKLSILSLVLLFVVAFAAVSALAGEQCSADKKGDKISATKASASGAACTPAEMEACAKAMGVSKEECAKMCVDGKYSMQTISIKGMTCGGCEQSVTTALEKIDGVQKVVSISHKDEKAVVCIDPAKCTDTGLLTKAVADKGFKATMVTAAVTKSGNASACAKTCSPKEQAACTPKVKAETKDGSK